MSLLAAVPVSIAVVLVVMLLPGTPARIPSAAAATFNRLSLTATTVPTTLGPGQYYYTEVERPTYEIAVGTSPGHSFNEYLDGTVQTWVAANGSGRVVTTTDPTPRFFTAADRAAWVAAGRPPAAVLPNQLTTVQQFGPNSGSEVNGPIPLYDVAGLPTDPTLLAHVLSNGEKPGNTLASLPKGISSLNDISQCATEACALFERAVALLQGPDIGATAAFRAALYQVLASVPGVKLLGPTTDSGGQSGIGAAYVEHQPPRTTTMTCNVASQRPSPAPSLAPAGDHYVVGPASGIVVTPAGATTEPTSANAGSAKTLTFSVPASTTTFTVVIDPRSATVLSSEQRVSPLMFPNLPNCAPGGGWAVRTTPLEHEVPPNWSVVLRQGIVDSDAAVAPGS
ncbi:MAG: hypothetical protein ACYCU7_01945 [Acidimicrobiales bacterium]